MKVELTSSDGVNFEVDITYISPIPYGHGHWKIVCLMCYGIYWTASFFHTTHDSELVDQIKGMVADDMSHEEIQEFIHEKVFPQFEERILNWHETLN
jgi:hypothetical protein